MSVAMPAGSHAASLRWSPTGEALAYLTCEGTSPGLAITPTLGLYILDVQTGQARQLQFVVSPEAMLHGWTPDGGTLLVEALDAFGGERTLRLIDTTSLQVVRVTIPRGAQIVGLAQGS